MSSRHHRRLLAPLFAGGLVLFSMAQSGVYEVRYEGGHTWTGAGSTPYQTETLGRVGSVTDGICTGTVTAVFTWRPSARTYEPPGEVFVRETVLAKAEGDLPKLLASNGLGDVPELSVGLVNLDKHRMERVLVARGERIRRIRQPGRSFRVTCSPSAMALGDSKATVRYAAEILTRVAAFETDRGLTFANLSGDRTPLDDPDLISPQTIHLGIPVADAESGFLQPKRWFSRLNLRVQRYGTWMAPKISWSVLPAGSGLPSDKLPMTGGGWSREIEWWLDEARYRSLFHRGPMVQEVKVRITDGRDPRIAVDTRLRIVLHSELENRRTVARHRTWYKPVPLEVKGDSRAVAGGSVSCRWLDRGLGELNLTTGLVDPPTRRERMFNGDAPWAWNYPGSRITAGSWSDSPSRFEMVPKLDHKFAEETWRWDRYDRNGFVGTVDRRFVGRVGARWSGDFRPSGASKSGDLRPVGLPSLTRP